MQVIVRPETYGDLMTVNEIVGAAFAAHRVDQLLVALRRSSAWSDLSFVAEADGQVLGHTCFTRGWVDAPDRLVEVLVLSPMAVHPSYQGRGIGSQLVVKALEALQCRPEPLVFLEGNPKFYSRLGFEPAADHGFARPSVRIPEIAFQVSFLPSYQRGLEGALVYPDVFWEHDAVGLRPGDPRLRSV